jgi:hypothetical protein
LRPWAGSPDTVDPVKEQRSTPPPAPGNASANKAARSLSRGVGQSLARVGTPDSFATSLAERSPNALLRHVERTPPERIARYLALLQAEIPDTLAIIVPLLDE